LHTEITVGELADRSGLVPFVYMLINPNPMFKKKTSMLLLLLASAGSTLFAQGITAPRTPSPGATVSQKIGISTVTVNYSRPSVKGRAVWGNLVPYGWNVQAFGAANSAPWRAGANENTVITFSHEGKIGGKTVPPGNYGLFFVINPDNSGEVILSKDYRSWGSFWYDQAHDLLRAPIQVRDIPHTEALTYDFINGEKNSAELVLNWEKKQFPVKIEFAVDQQVMANATEELKGPVGFNWQGYNSAANYALQNKINLEQALKWADQAVNANNSFTTVNVKAGILQELGRTAEADKLRTAALGTATENELNIYGYQLLGENKFDKAIEILALNTKNHPESANAWDSLGEACALKGDKPNAIKHFKKSLTLNPPAGTKANSEKYLKQLGAI
jgi:tetratricopeptide (TPR) repeat protein